VVHQIPQREGRRVLVVDLWLARVASPLPHVAQRGKVTHVLSYGLDDAYRQLMASVRAKYCTNCILCLKI